MTEENFEGVWLIERCEDDSHWKMFGMQHGLDSESALYSYWKENEMMRESTFCSGNSHYGLFRTCCWLGVAFMDDATIARELPMNIWQWNYHL